MVKNGTALLLAAWFAVLFLVVLVSTPARAGVEEQTSVGLSTREAVDIGAMIVTAQKQEENVQEVPIAMSVFNEVTIQDRMMDTLMDIGKYTPGLELKSYGGSTYVSPTMRGIYSDYSTMASTVGLFVDGVPVTGATGYDETLLDIERIEVLKGPQGTLYGKNTEVGAINVITKKPSNELQARATLELGEDNKRVLYAVVSGPIVKDKFYLGISAKHYEKDGFVENAFLNEPVNDREHNYGKVNLRWTPTDSLEVSFITSLVKYDDGGSPFNFSGVSDRKVASDMSGYNQSETLLGSLSISYDFNDSLSVSSITAYRDYNQKNAEDWDFSSYDEYKFHNFADSDYVTLSEELKLNYTTDKIKALAGIFLEVGDYDNNRFFDTSWYNTEIAQETDLKSTGIFTHITYALTDKLAVLGGLRYDTDEKDYEDEYESISYDEDEISPKLGVTYNISDSMMTYVTFAKGYRAGGFNALTLGDYSKTFETETLYSYEIGTKGSLLDGRLTYDASIYYMDISDMQVDIYISPSEYIKDNAAEATSQGIELSVDYRIMDGLSVFAGFSYNDTTFDKYNNGVEDLSGNNTTYAPEYDFTLGALYRSVNGFYASADISGYGDTYLDPQNEYKRAPYELVNMKIGYEAAHYDVYLYAKNIFDEVYDDVGMFGGYYDLYSEPREVGVILTYRL